MCGPSLVGASVSYTRCPHWDSSITEGGRAGGSKDRMGRGQGLYTQDMGVAPPFAFQAGRISLGSAPLRDCVPPAASNPPREEISHAHPPDPEPVTTGWEGRAGGGNGRFRGGKARDKGEDRTTQPHVTWRVLVRNNPWKGAFTAGLKKAKNYLCAQSQINEEERAVWMHNRGERYTQ